MSKLITLSNDGATATVKDTNITDVLSSIREPVLYKAMTSHWLPIAATLGAAFGSTNNRQLHHPGISHRRRKKLADKLSSFDSDDRVLDAYQQLLVRLDRYHRRDMQYTKLHRPKPFNPFM